MRTFIKINLCKLAVPFISSVCLFLAGCEEHIALEPPAEAVFGTIAFQDVRIIIGVDNEILDNHTVIVTGSRISEIGPTGSTTIPDDAFLIDGTGLTLMPGLTDMHAHYEDEGIGPLFVINGVTSVRNMWGQGNDQFIFDSRAKNGNLVGPNVYTTGPIIDGPNPVHAPSVLINTPEAAKEIINQQFAMGYKGIKLYEMLTEELFIAAVAAAKANGMRISSHTPIAMQVEDLLELKITSIEHLDGYGLALSRGQFDSSVFHPFELPLESWKHVNEEAMKPLALQTTRANVWNVPTLTYYLDQFRYAADAAEFFQRSEMRYVQPNLKAFWRARLKGMESTLPSLLERVDKGEGTRLKFVKTLYDAGAPLLIGTDTPNPFLIPGYSFHDELDNYSEADIPNTAILRMATSEAARFLEVDGEFGVVTTGARADLLLIDGDPLQDLSVLREPVGVMVNGHWRTRDNMIEVLEYNASQFEISLLDKFWIWLRGY